MEGAVRSGRHRTGAAGRAVRSRAEWEVLRDLAREGDYFQVLGVERGCSTSEVRDAWVRLSARIDMLKRESTGRLEVFDALEEVRLVAEDAFEILSDPDLRMRYRRALEPVGEEQGWPF